MAKGKKKAAPKPTYWQAVADAQSYGINASRGAAIVAARAEKARQEKENYEYWRQTSGLGGGGAASPAANADGALTTGLTLQGTQIVPASGQPLQDPPDLKPSTTGQTSAAAARPSTPGSATVYTPRPSSPAAQRPGGGAVKGAAGSYTNMTPEEQAQAQGAVDQARQQQEEQGFLGTVFEGSTHWLSDLFNTEDEKDLNILGANLSGVESVWDGAFAAVGWFYDRMSQGMSMGVSAMPGGLDTYTWDQANEISVGQSAVADAARRTNQMEASMGALGGALSMPVNLITGGLLGGALGTYAAIGDNEAAPFAATGFNIHDEAQRKAAFEDSTVGKWTTGLTDTAVSIIADPTIIAGKALKITKLRYLDRLIKSEDDIRQIGAELAQDSERLANNANIVTPDGGVQIRAVEDLTKEEVRALELSPMGMFAHDVIRKGKHQGKEMSAEQIFNHPVIQNAFNRDALTAALHNAETYEQAQTILKFAAGDRVGAMKALDEMRPDLLEQIISGERQLATTLLGANPTLVARETAKWSDRADTMKALLQRAERSDISDAEKVNLRQSFSEVYDMWENARRGEIDKVGVGPTATADEIDLLSRSIDARLETNHTFIRSLEKANGGTAETFGAFQGSTKGFGRNTKINRAIEERRQTTAMQKTIAQTRQGQNKKIRPWTTDEFYDASTGNVIARVLHWAGSERASGMISTAGVGAQESSREIMALLNGIRIFGGEAKMVEKTLADGTKKTVKVGGIERKQELINSYQRALLKGDTAGQSDTRKLIESLEDQLAEEIALYHGIDPELMGQLHYWQNGKLTKVASDIKEKGYWIDEKGSKNYAPFLESQLQSMSFMKNWRKIDEMVSHMSRDNSSLTRTVDGVVDFTKENFSIANGLIQDFWRPAVLLRAGYTQRNVAEGVFRSAAFQWSLMPVVNVGRQSVRSTGNVSRRAMEKVSGEARKTVEAAEKGLTLDKMPKRFQKWHAENKAAIQRELDVNKREVADGRDNLLQNYPEYRAARLTQLEKKAAQISNRVRALRKADPNDPEIARLLRELNGDGTSIGVYGDMKRIKAMTGGDLPVTREVRELVDTFDYLDDYYGKMLELNLESMDDMVAATASYRSQTLARRRLYNGSQDSTDPQTFAAVMKGKALEDAFDADSPYANIALSNLSADHTARQAVGMRSNAVAASLSMSQLRHHKPIMPDSDEYMPAMARTLNQWSNSTLGKIIVDGRAAGLEDADIVDNIVGTLFDGEQGLELRRWLNEADELWARGNDNYKAYVGVGSRRQQALKKAEEAVAPLDDEISVLEASLRSANARRATALREFKKAQAKNPRRVNIKFTDIDGKQRTFRGKDKLDEYLGKQRLKLDDLKTKRQTTFDRESKFTMDEHRLNVGEPEDAMRYAEVILDRYDKLTAGSVPLQRWLAGGNLRIGVNGQTDDAARSIEQFLKATDANGNPVYQLHPVLGDEAQKIGAASALDAFRGATQKAFRVIGAVPEDTFVRAPFYGQRYRQTAERAYKILTDQRGTKDLSLDEVNAIRELAHRRALKDTKDWLYTIDRRTAFGQVMENWVPFASATQNSVTTVGRIIWNDPAVVGAMALIWQSPDAIFDADNDGNPDTFTIPVGWLPDGFQEALGIDEYLRFNKKSFDLITQGTFDATATPMLAMATSELMKNSLGGRYSAAPPLLLEALPGETGEALWEKWKDFNFGEGFGASQSWGSLDMVLAPWMKQALDVWFRGDGSSASYARTFDSIRRSENLKAVSGYREDFPTYDEVEAKARGTMMLRLLGTVTMFTTPRYSSDVDVLVNAVKRNDQAIREWDNTPEDQRVGERPMPTEELYGDAAAWIAASGTRSNTSGMPNSLTAIGIAERNTSLIRDIAPALNDTGDLSLLGALVPNSEAHFAFDDPEMNDPTVTAYQMANTIPGAAGETYRSLVDLAEEQYSVNKEMGWKAYIKGKSAIEAVMNQRGVWDWNSAAARPYKEMKDGLVESIATDKRYEGWFDDFNKHAGGTRTSAAITMFETAAGDDNYRSQMEDDGVWMRGGPLDQYLANRRAVVQEMERLGIGSLASRKGGDYRGQLSGLAATWEQSKAEIRRAYPQWGAFQDRFIGDDNDPAGLGVYLETASVEEAAPSAPPAYPGDETISPPQSYETGTQAQQPYQYGSR